MHMPVDPAFQFPLQKPAHKNKYEYGQRAAQEDVHTYYQGIDTDDTEESVGNKSLSHSSNQGYYFKKRKKLESYNVGLKNGSSSHPEGTSSNMNQVFSQWSNATVVQEEDFQSRSFQLENQNVKSLQISLAHIRTSTSIHAVTTNDFG